MAQRLKRLPAVQETRVRSLRWEDPLDEGNGSPLQDSCLQNPMDGGAWRATVHRVAKSRTRLSDFIFFHFSMVMKWSKETRTCHFFHTDFRKSV